MTTNKYCGEYTFLILKGKVKHDYNDKEKNSQVKRHWNNFSTKYFSKKMCS